MMVMTMTMMMMQNLRLYLANLKYTEFVLSNNKFLKIQNIKNNNNSYKYDSN
jgi:hypothetical protein